MSAQNSVQRRFMPRTTAQRKTSIGERIKMRVFTLKEAAIELRMSYNRLREIVKRHPYYYPNGNRKLFTDDNLASIRSALLDEKLNKEGRHQITVQAGLSASKAYEKALAMCAKPEKRNRPKRAIKRKRLERQPS